MTFYCHYCHKSFARKYGVVRYIRENRCKLCKNDDMMSEFNRMMLDNIVKLERELEELKNEFRGNYFT
jgi:transposase-like protein